MFETRPSTLASVVNRGLEWRRKVQNHPPGLFFFLTLTSNREETLGKRLHRSELSQKSQYNDDGLPVLDDGLPVRQSHTLQKAAFHSKSQWMCNLCHFVLLSTYCYYFFCIAFRTKKLQQKLSSKYATIVHKFIRVHLFLQVTSISATFFRDNFLHGCKWHITFSNLLTLR